MTSPPGLLSMNKISTKCQINSSLYINSDCSSLKVNEKESNPHLPEQGNGKPEKQHQFRQDVPTALDNL